MGQWFDKHFWRVEWQLAVLAFIFFPLTHPYAWYLIALDAGIGIGRFIEHRRYQQLSK